MRKTYNIPTLSLLGQLMQAYKVPLSGRSLPVSEFPDITGQTRNIAAGALKGFIDLSVLKNGPLFYAIQYLINHSESPSFKADRISIADTPSLSLPISFSDDGRPQYRQSLSTSMSCSFATRNLNYSYNLIIVLPLAPINTAANPYSMMRRIIDMYPLPYQNEARHGTSVQLHVRVFPKEHPMHARFPNGILYFPKNYHIDTEPSFKLHPSIRL